MKLVDTNVLLYAVNPACPEHRPAKTWLDSALSGGAPVGFAWLGLIGFVRIATHPAIFERPLTPAQALTAVDAWLEAAPASVLQPKTAHLAILRRLLGHARSAGNLTNDAHLAALALEHKATVVTFDSDFGKFPDVRWERPR
ncbi:MAG TPA: type II toxin-antitoxin system VapC family toxin [Beutenbergiaceae bacterium]|nr:type II toxin-antitoxin system VapC family toxin [Beutenbergiaceae bacterium]